MEIPDIQNKTGLNKFDSEQMDKVKLQLQELNDTIQGGLRSANFKEYRNTYVINAQDSLDASFPMYTHFNIISEMTKIVSVKLSFWFLNFRAYSTTVASGGGSTSGSGGGQTSSSGGGQTTSSGGSSTPTTSSGGGQTSSSTSTPSGGGSTSGATGSASGGGSTSGVTGASIYTATATKTHTYLENQTTYDEVFLTTGGDPFRTAATHSRTGYEVSHKHYMGDHSHSTPAHTHPNHTHSTPAHTHPSHSHTVSNHTHSVTIANHTHTVANHTHTVANHTHSTPDHTHDITYGIYEDSQSPTVMVYISKDNGKSYSLPIGSYTADHENLDITSHFGTAGGKLIRFTTNARTRLSVQITVKLDISAI